MSFSSPNQTAYINRLVRQGVISDQVQARPLMYFMLAASQVNADLLLAAQDDPQANFTSGIVLGGNATLSQAQRLNQVGSDKREIRHQVVTPDGVQNVAPNATSSAAATKFADELVGLAKYGFAYSKLALRVKKATLDGAQGPLALASVADEAVAFGKTQFFKDINAQTLGGTATLVQQQAQEVPNLLGLRHQVSNGLDNSATNSGPDETAYRYQGEVDRQGTNGEHIRSTVLWPGNLIASDHLSNTTPNLSLIRKIKSIPALGGLQNFAGDGGMLCIVSPTTFETLAEESLGSHQVEHIAANQPFPALGLAVGFSRPMLLVSGTYCTYDPIIPDSEMYMLTPSSWMYEVRPKYNYTFSGWIEHDKVEEAGGRYLFGHCEVAHRLICCAPHMNVKVVGLNA